MWQAVVSSRKRIKGRHISARRSRSYRPYGSPLEGRCLLSVSLSGSEPPVPLVGSPVTWTATANGDGPSPVYQFRVGPVGGATQVVQDYSPSDSFTWNPIQQGSYEIQVTVKDSFSASTGDSATASYTAESRVVGTGAVISPTGSPGRQRFRCHRYRESRTNSMAPSPCSSRHTGVRAARMNFRGSTIARAMRGSERSDNWPTTKR